MPDHEIVLPDGGHSVRWIEFGIEGVGQNSHLCEVRTYDVDNQVLACIAGQVKAKRLEMVQIQPQENIVAAKIGTKDDFSITISLVLYNLDLIKPQFSISN